jgi:hypothetical protein
VLASGLTATEEMVLRHIKPHVRRSLAGEVEAALGDWEQLPEDVRFRFADLLHRWRHP